MCHSGINHRRTHSFREDKECSWMCLQQTRDNQLVMWSAAARIDMCRTLEHGSKLLINNQMRQMLNVRAYSKA